MNKSLFYQALRFFSVITCSLLIYIFLKYTFLFFYPFLLALLFSFMINPLVTYVVINFRIKRIFATFMVVFIILIIMSGLFILIFTELIQGSVYLAVEIPKHSEILTNYMNTIINEEIIPFYEKITILFDRLNQTQQSTVSDQVQQFITYITTSATELLSQGLLKIPVIISMIPYSIAMFFFTIMATFFITNDWYMLRDFGIKMIPTRLQSVCNDLILYFRTAFIGFIKAQFILIFISTCITLIGLLILNINHALTISLLIAFVDLLPLLGTGMIFLPWIGYLFFVKNYALTIGLAILYMIIVIVRQILEPKILADSIGINPLVALITIFVSLKFWGVLGIIIAPFLLISIHTFYQSGLLRKIWLFIKTSNP